MVEDGYADDAGCEPEPPGQRAVVFARRGVAGRMVVSHDRGGGGMVHEWSEDLAWMNLDVGEAATGDLDDVDDSMAGIQGEYEENLLHQSDEMMPDALVDVIGGSNRTRVSVSCAQVTVASAPIWPGVFWSMAAAWPRSGRGSISPLGHCCLGPVNGVVFFDLAQLTQDANAIRRPGDVEQPVRGLADRPQRRRHRRLELIDSRADVVETHPLGSLGRWQQLAVNGHPVAVTTAMQGQKTALNSIAGSFPDVGDQRALPIVEERGNRACCPVNVVDVWVSPIAISNGWCGYEKRPAAVQPGQRAEAMDI